MYDYDGDMGYFQRQLEKAGYCTYPVVKLDIEKIGEYLEVA